MKKQCKYEKPTFGFILCGEYEQQTHCCDVENCYYKTNEKFKKTIEKIANYSGLDNTNQILAQEILKEITNEN